MQAEFLSRKFASDSANAARFDGDDGGNAAAVADASGDDVVGMTRNAVTSSLLEMFDKGEATRFMDAWQQHVAPHVGEDDVRCQFCLFHGARLFWVRCLRVDLKNSEEGELTSSGRQQKYGQQRYLPGASSPSPSPSPTRKSGAISPSKRMTPRKSPGSAMRKRAMRSARRLRPRFSDFESTWTERGWGYCPEQQLPGRVGCSPLCFRPSQE